MTALSRRRAPDPLPTRLAFDAAAARCLSVCHPPSSMQVNLPQLLQFDEKYGNTDRSALGASYPPSTVPAQKLGVLEENSNGEKGYGGCDGRDPDGQLYICEDRDESGECTQKNYEDGALCTRWERGSCPPFVHMDWLESKGLKSHNLCLCYSRLLNSNPHSVGQRRICSSRVLFPLSDSAERLQRQIRPHRAVGPECGGANGRRGRVLHCLR